MNLIQRCKAEFRYSHAFNWFIAAVFIWGCVAGAVVVSILCLQH